MESFHAGLKREFLQHPWSYTLTHTLMHAYTESNVSAIVWTEACLTVGEHQMGRNGSMDSEEEGARKGRCS